MAIASTTNNFDAAAMNAQLGVKTSSTGSALASAAEQADRFLTLLVTQMKNQDPLNPMDNAQITTQMAQISTVSGIDKLSAALGDMNALMLQTQTLEGAALVGKQVLVAGSKLSLDADGSATAGFELAGAAQSVTVSIKNASGKVIDTVEMGKVAAGRHIFQWTGTDPKAQGLTFEVSAKNGATAVAATRLVTDRVDAVYSENGQLSIALVGNGTVKYSEIKGVS